MKSLPIILLCAAALTLSGCITGRPQFLPKIDLACSVKDAATQAPIKGASLRVVYQCWHTAREMVFEGFVTDEKGECHLTVPEKSVWLDMNEAFGGGFRRRIDVTASGYHEGGFDEGLDYGSMKNTGERTFLLKLKK